MKDLLRKTAIYFGIRSDPHAPAPEIESPRVRLTLGLFSYAVFAVGWAVLQAATGEDPLSGLALGFLGVIPNEVSQWQLRRKARRPRDDS